MILTSAAASDALAPLPRSRPEQACKLLAAVRSTEVHRAVHGKTTPRGTEVHCAAPGKPRHAPAGSRAVFAPSSGGFHGDKEALRWRKDLIAFLLFVWASFCQCTEQLSFRTVQCGEQSNGIC
jgi:hypothetical protein